MSQIIRVVILLNQIFAWIAPLIAICGWARAGQEMEVAFTIPKMYFSAYLLGSEQAKMELHVFYIETLAKLFVSERNSLYLFFLLTLAVQNKTFITSQSFAKTGVFITTILGLVGLVIFGSNRFALYILHLITPRFSRDPCANTFSDAVAAEIVTWISRGTSAWSTYTLAKKVIIPKTIGFVNRIRHPQIAPQ
jgi:hypothetical protein